jgi:predicted DNA-binding transcriptional regulator YafY
MFNKTPLLRYKIINACLISKSKPYPTMKEIKAELEKNDITVSTRAFEADIEAMRFDKSLGFFAPIAFNRKHHGYHYTDPDYSIEKLPLSHGEVEAFELIVDSFKRFRGAKILNQVAGMFDKLDKVVYQLKSKKKNADPVVDFEDVPYSKGIEYFDKLYKAIQQKQTLRIQYLKFDRQLPTDHLFHPYLLKEYRFRWYVLGYSETRKGKVVLALDRIHSMVTSKKLFKPYKGIDLQQYFSHTLGVTINKTGIKKIKLWCSPSQGNYFKTQHLHASQEIVSDTRDGLVITLDLIPNYELLQTLLSYGPEVKVLEPESVRTDMMKMLERSLANYEAR